MPQLNPTPWFLILIISWTILLTVMLPLTLGYTTNNDPRPLELNNLKNQPLTWPWA